MRINIIAHPNSKKPRVEKDVIGQINVYVSAPPIDGKANKEVTKSLADYFKIKKSAIRLISGSKSHLKLFDVDI